MVQPHAHKSLVCTLGLEKTKAVVAVAADLDFRWEALDGTDLALCGAVVAGEGEARVLDAGVLAEVEVGDVDVLVLGRVGGRAAAVCWVGAICCLRSGCGEGGGREEGGGGEELHFEVESLRYWVLGVDLVVNRVCEKSDEDDMV